MLKMIIKSMCAVVACAGGMSAMAAEKPSVMKFCYESENTFPWVMKDRPGLNLVLLEMVEKKIGVKIELAAQPWKRCQAEMKTGAFDGIFAASFKPDRLEIGVYPMKGDKPDEAFAMMMDGYTLYQLKGGKASWDGSKLNIQGAVGAQPGYSIIDQLKGLGARVDDGAKGADTNLSKLLEGRVEAVALQTLEGENAISKNPAFVAKIEKMSPPLVNKPFFLMLSKQFVAKNGDFAKEVWAAVAAVRESSEFKAKAAAFK